MKKMITMISTMLVTVALAATVFAADSFKGKVTKIDGTKVTVTTEKKIPSWVKKGSNVTAIGGSPKVLEVKGNEMVLRFGSAKASKIKADTDVTISAPSGDELQGC